MKHKLSRHLAREFARNVASAVVSEPLASIIRAGSGAMQEHKAVAEAVEQLLRTFLAEHDIEEEGEVDWEGKQRSPGVRQQQSYALLGTWTHPDLAVVAPFTVAFEFDREGDTWAGYKLSLMKAACHALTGAYDAVVHVFTLKYADSSRGIYLHEDGPLRFAGEQPNVYTRQLMALLTAHGVVPAFVPAGPGAPYGEPPHVGD